MYNPLLFSRRASPESLPSACRTMFVPSHLWRRARSACTNVVFPTPLAPVMARCAPTDRHGGAGLVGWRERGPTPELLASARGVMPRNHEALVLGPGPGPSRGRVKPVGIRDRLAPARHPLAGDAPAVDRRALRQQSE